MEDFSIGRLTGLWGVGPFSVINLFMADERRIQSRLPLRMIVEVRVHDVSEFMREYAVNISPGGMFIRTLDPRPKGSMIYLQFRLEEGGKLIEGLGKVIHVNPQDHPIPGMGVEFVNLDPESGDLIQSILDERAAELE